MNGYGSNVGSMSPPYTISSEDQARIRAEDAAEAARLQQEYEDGLAQRRPLNSNSNSNSRAPSPVKPLRTPTSGSKRRRPNVSVEEEDLYERVEELEDKIREIVNLSKAVPANQFGSLEPDHNNRILEQIAYARAYSKNLKETAEDVFDLLKQLDTIEQGIIGKKSTASFFGRGGNRKTRRSQRSRKNKNKSKSKSRRH
jgi:hypothetical protein